MIYRGSGFLAVVWFGSSTTPSPPPVIMSTGYTQETEKERQVNRGIFLDFFMYVLYSTLLHLPPLRFHCVEWCWERIGKGVGEESNHMTARKSWSSINQWTHMSVAYFQFSFYAEFPVFQVLKVHWCSYDKLFLNYPLQLAYDIISCTLTKGCWPHPLLLFLGPRRQV
jgi:hypothetical protein